MKYQKLFTPMTIGSITVKNRFAMAPMGPLGLSDSDGGFNQRGIDYYVERAKGGTGLIMTGVTFADDDVEQHGLPNCPSPTHNPIQFIRTAREMTERIHAYNAKIFLQMSAGFGRVTIPTNLGEIPPVAPSEIQHRWLDKTCRALTVEEIHHIIKQFGNGAYNAKRAGFDGIQIHAVHEGYLLDQFAISLFNHRTDEYGGSLENRLRFAKEIVEEIHQRCGEDFPVTLRFSLKSFIKDLRDGALPGEEFEEKGRDIEEGIAAAKMLVSYGYCALDVDVGTYDAWWWNHPPMYIEKGPYRPYAKIVKENVDVPVFCAGRMDNPDMALAAIEDGTCDIISLGRPLLADPDYVNKLRRGDIQDIRPCLSCQEGCMGRIQEYSALNCAVNPQACRERYTAYRPVIGAPKNVLIVGGGVAGLEAARVLAIRGHHVSLVEATDRLGGNLIPGGAPSFKEDDHLLVKWYEYQMKKLKVDVTLNKKVTREEVLAHNYDSVIIATGSTPKHFSLGHDETTYSAEDVLNKKVDPGQNVAVIGGGLVGCELAIALKDEGRNVALVEALDKILALNGPLCAANKEMLERLVPYKDVQMYTSSQAKAYDGKTLTITTPDGEKQLPADSVVLAVGYKEEASLYESLQFDVPDIHLLGDARKVSNIMYAIWDAFEVANSL